MSIETTKNRDLMMKLCFMILLNQILMILGINEKIIDVQSIEEITFRKYGKPKIFENLLDFKVITKSGKVLIFEFKKRALSRDDLKQAYNYYKKVSCKCDKEVLLIMITLSSIVNIKSYATDMITFHPKILWLKLFDKRKDLKRIRDKFKNNKMLTLMDCALLITLPFFDIGVDEAKIVKETCEYIQNKKSLIPEEKLDDVLAVTYLNILEYLDESEHEKYEKMIGMPRELKGIFEQYSNNRAKRIINAWISDGGSIDRISQRTGMPIDEIQDILDTPSFGK